MNGKREIRRQVGDLLRSLHELDTQVLELCESLPLPPDASEMWELQIPTDFTANVYGALETVRSGCLAEAISTLQRACGQTDASLRSSHFQQDREVTQRVRKLLENAVYPSDTTTKTPVDEPEGRSHRDAEDS